MSTPTPSNPAASHFAEQLIGLRPGDRVDFIRDDGTVCEHVVRCAPYQSPVWFIGLAGLTGHVFLDRIVGIVRQERSES